MATLPLAEANALAAAHASIIEAVARKLARRRPDALDEMRSRAGLALTLLSRAFDPERNRDGMAGFGPWAVHYTAKLTARANHRTARHRRHREEAEEAGRVRPSQLLTVGLDAPLWSLPSDEPQPWKALDEADLLRAIVGAMPDEDRRLLSERFLEGVPAAELAVRYGVERTVVNGRIARALRRARQSRPCCDIELED